MSSVFCKPVYVLVLFSCLACSTKNKSSRGSGDGSTEETSTLEINPLAESYPEGLKFEVFSSETQADTAVTTGSLDVGDAGLRLSAHKGFNLYPSEESLGLLSACETYRNNSTSCACSAQGHREIHGNSFQKPDLEFIDKPLSEKLQESRERLIGSEDVDCLSTDLGKVINIVSESSVKSELKQVFCYQFDWGLEYGYEVTATGRKKDNADVCLVAFTKAQTVEAQNYIDLALMLPEALLCLAKKSGKSQVLEEEKFFDAISDDQTTDMKNISFSQMKLTRLKNDGENKVYKTDVKFSKIDADSGESIDYDLHVVHTPLNAKNTDYVGKIWMEHNIPEREGGATEDRNKKRAMSLKYSTTRESDDAPARVKFEQRVGSFKNIYDPLGEIGIVDFNVGANFDVDPSNVNYGRYGTAQDSNAELSSMKYISFDGYPTENVMNFSYWQNPGARYKENARGFVFNVYRDDDNVVRGCGIAGAFRGASSNDGSSIRKALKDEKTLIPRGYLRPFMCEYEANARYGTKVWRQCFYQKDDGRYEIDRTMHTGDFEFLSATDKKIADLPPPPPPKDFDNAVFENRY